ncbi:MAG: methionyl-tRNA formyltransferase [Mailhella sp.]|nr:methionyl-tRNA formyltransferase [Mailhella sp.]
MNKLRIVFMGTPDFAASILRSLAEYNDCCVTAVYTQPDRPAGRGKKLRPSAVKTLADELGLPVYQPLNFRNRDDVDALAAMTPDVLVVAAYGLILPQSVLDIPSLFPLNVHASLLPRYRGAAPIQRAVMNGDHVTGVSIMKMEAGLDTGPVLLQQAVSIEPGDTAGTLFDELALHGSQLIVGALRMIAEGRAAFVPQNSELATYAHKITANEELIDWSFDAHSIHNLIRGLSPFPGARTTLLLDGKAPLPLRLTPGEPIDTDTGCTPGTLVGMHGQSLVVACGSGAYKVNELRPAGKGTMKASDFRNGWLKGMNEPFGRMALVTDSF